MGLYIKGMEMPTGCCALTVKVWPDGQVEIINADGEWKTSEAVHVPPHGDLIDRDELKKKELVIDGIIHYYEPISIEEAPVIIQASEEGET